MANADEPRTCRYQHGALVHVNTLHGEPVHFGLVWWSHSVFSGPQYLTGLRWYVCPTCGYTEMQDPDPAQTMRLMGRSNG